MTEAFDVLLEGDSMWPTFVHGDVLTFSHNESGDFTKGDVLLVRHPFNGSLLMVKRLKRILDDGRLFVEGDQVDPTASEDSHNFGPIHVSNVVGRWTGLVKRA